MGDHRVSFKISFEMHGHEKTWDAWLNWSDNLPQMVADWFEAQHSKAMENWFDEECAREDRAKAERENAERKLLAELKQKYDGTDQ